MLFNSYEFIYVFLPITFVIYFILNKNKLLADVWLIIASFVYYSWFNILYLPLLIGSILFNYLIGRFLINGKQVLYFDKKYILLFGISFNVIFLGYFKYADFLIDNINFALNTQLDLLHLALPLAISFFTFQQIAYLVDCYKEKIKEYNFLNYTIFISLFSKLFAGPIVYHKELMPQIKDSNNKFLNYKNIAIGLFIFFIGLFKKVVIADTFAMWVNNGFDNAEILNFFEAWATSISYTFQIYFDFSGYTDMAIGSALLFNIRLPINFNSPYKALNIQDFWKRWHITLSRFLKDYIYIPLGGNQRGDTRIYINIMITFLIGGLWHGAGWTFIFWGFLHGLGSIIHKLWKKLDIKMNSFLAWFLTFNFINIAWIFFRAKEWKDAMKVLKGMFGFSEIIFPLWSKRYLSLLEDLGIEFGTCLKNIEDNTKLIIMILLFMLISLFTKNSMEMSENFKSNWKTALSISILAIWSLLLMNSNKVSEFLYYNF